MELISINYNNKKLEAYVPKGSIIFEGTLTQFQPLDDFENTLLKKLENPTATLPLKELVKSKNKVLILVDDNTRVTPVYKILPVLVDYLNKAGIADSQIQLLTAPGTHRVMTEDEIIQKIGYNMAKRLEVFQHDYNDEKSMEYIGDVLVNEVNIPIIVNKKALEADFIIGIGNIIPHSDAGFSGGGKIVQPGICGKATTSATHLSGALMSDIPLGVIDNNPCRDGINKVAQKVGLSFIVNVVMSPEEEIIDVFTGDLIKAHLEGCELSKKVYGVPIKELADIVVVSVSPFDIDYWQAEKGLVSAYFTVKKGGIIIFAASCYEGLEHNHAPLIDWCKLTYEESKVRALQTKLDSDDDLVAADIAMANSRVRERASVFIVTDGLSDEQINILGYSRFDSLQDALDMALEVIPNGTVGVLPRAGDCLPIIV